MLPNPNSVIELGDSQVALTAAAAAQEVQAEFNLASARNSCWLSGSRRASNRLLF
jgi:hypothetical protein